MHEFRRALIFWIPALIVVVLAAAALAAPVHEVLLDIGWAEKPASDYDHHREFLKIFRRLLLVPLPLLFLVRVRPWRDGALRAFGLLGPQARFKPAVCAAALTLAALVAVFAWQIAMGWLRWEQPPRWGEFGKRLLWFVPSGILIGIGEEFFFRGWLLRRFRQDVSLPVAAFVAALIYGLVHAFKPTALTVDVTHDFQGALEALSGWLGFMFDFTAFGPALLGLFLFALLLTAAYLRTRTLWTGIAVHAAAVWVLFTYGALTDRAPARTWAGTKALYDGPVVWAILALAAFLLWPRKRPASTESGAG